MTTSGILILEKNRLEYLLLKERLCEVGFSENHLLHATSLADLEKPGFLATDPSFLFLDLFLPDSSGINTFLIVQRRFPEVPIVILTDLTDKETATQCIHLGAQDYLVKGEFSNQLLNKTIRFATERNAYRKELVGLKGDYENLFRKNPMPMWVFDFETHLYLSVNEATVEKYGYTEEEFKSLRIDDIHLKEDLPKLNALLATATPDDRMQSRGIWRHVKKSGEILYAEIFSAPIRYQDRIAAIGSSVDVTEEKLRNQEALETRNNYETLIDAIPDLIWSVNPAIEVVSANRAFRQRMEELTGKPLRSGDPLIVDNIVPDAEKQAWQEHYLRALAGEHVVKEDVIHLNTGEVAFAEVRLSPIRGADGQIVGVACYSKESTGYRQQLS